MNKHQITANLSDDDKNEILTKVSEIKAKLPFLIDLTRTERLMLRKMGHKSGFYINDCIRVGKSFPKILPPTLNVQEIEKDLVLHNSISDISIMLKTLADSLEDTMMTAGSNAMVASDLIYGYLKQGAKQDPNLKAQVEQIAVHYKKAKRKTEE